MLEIFFLIGFVVMLMVTGISLLGIFAALLVAAAFMLLGGLFAVVIKLLPWLILAVVGVWIYRSMQKPRPGVTDFSLNNQSVAMKLAQLAAPLMRQRSQLGSFTARCGT